MIKKIEISNIEKYNIYNKYLSGISIRKLENEYPYSFGFIQKLIKSINHKFNLEKNYSDINGKDIVAVCILTNKEIFDYKNQSGAILTHLLKTYPNINIETNYIRKSIEYKTGKFWYHDYFNFVYKDNSQYKECYYCEWKTTDINNQSGAYEKHLKIIHKKELKEYLIDNPTDRKYFKKDIYNELIKCKICGKDFKMINNKHLKSHNISLLDYKLLYGANVVSKETNKKLSIACKEFNRKSTFRKTSKPENDLNLYIESLGFKTSRGKRKILDGFEIDINILNTNYAIEFNGNKYHTEIFGNKTKNYHLNKTNICNDNNINLLHIFEDEWFYKNEIVKSKISHILKESNLNSIYGRKTKVLKIENKSEKSDFLNKNHIQGNDKSQYCYGLYYNNLLVAIMCFDNKRVFNKTKNHNTDIYELTRYATHIDYRVIGGASKLLKFFINNKKPEKIISFADRRWSILGNNLYSKLGFNITKILLPDYTYFNSKYDRYKRFHKFGFGKKSLKKKYPEVYNENKTEWEIMQELGWDRIWDCGKIRYELNIF